MVGLLLGVAVGTDVVGVAVGIDEVGLAVGAVVGDVDGDTVGAVGDCVGPVVGDEVGSDEVGECDGALVGAHWPHNAGQSPVIPSCPRPSLQSAAVNILQGSGSSTPWQDPVGLLVGASLGLEKVGERVGEAVVGEMLGEPLGTDVVGAVDGPDVVGAELGAELGLFDEGALVGPLVGEMVLGHVSHLTGHRVAAADEEQSARAQTAGSIAPLHCPVGATDGNNVDGDSVGDMVGAAVPQ